MRPPPATKREILPSGLGRNHLGGELVDSDGGDAADAEHPADSGSASVEGRDRKLLSLRGDAQPDRGLRRAESPEGEALLRCPQNEPPFERLADGPVYERVIDGHPGPAVRVGATGNRSHAAPADGYLLHDA